MDYKKQSDTLTEAARERLEQIRDDLRAGRLVKVDHPDGSATLYEGPYAEKSKPS